MLVIFVCLLFCGGSFVAVVAFCLVVVFTGWGGGGGCAYGFVCLVGLGWLLLLLLFYYTEQVLAHNTHFL